MSLSYSDPKCGECKKKETCIIYKNAKGTMPYCSDYDGPVYWYR